MRLSLVLGGISWCLPMDLTVAKSGLGHTPEQADPSPRNSSNMSLIYHWEVLYLCHRHGSGKIVEVPLHLTKYPIGLTSIWNPRSPHVPGLPIRVHRSHIWSTKNTHVNHTDTSKNHIYAKNTKKERKTRSYLYVPTRHPPAVEGRDRHSITIRIRTASKHPTVIISTLFTEKCL